MSLAIHRGPHFITDFGSRFTWYLEQAGPKVAWRFQAALDISLQKLARQPDLGRRRHFGHPKLQDMRSYRVEPPFDKVLIFYRVEADVLQAIRLMHGARNLPRRLAEPPD